jgi:hypothetical protein
LGIPDLCGVWRLKAFYLEVVDTGQRIEPFGPAPKGALIMHPGGRMMAVITPGEQKAPASEADQADAFRKLVAYSGLYRLEPPDRFVTSVDVAWFQPWLGTDQARTFSLDGDALYIMSAPTGSPMTGNSLAVGVLSWLRESPA